jgi:hypothetical protein
MEVSQREAVNKKVDALDRFIANERKAKQWTLISVVLFCLMAMVIIYFAGEAKEAKTELEKKNKEIAELNAKLIQINNGLIQDTISLSSKAGNYDSLTKALDTMAILLRKSQVTTDSTGIVNQLEQISNIAFVNKKAELSKDLRDAIVNARVTELANKAKRYTVYLYCMEEYRQHMTPIANLLEKNGYEVIRMKWVTSTSFSPTVKYFHANDAAQAKKIQDIVQGYDRYFSKNPVDIQQVSLKSPANQLEVWIGKYIKPDIQVQQYLKDPKMRQIRANR